MALSAGHRLGPYKILSTLGAGGMGEVYRARDSRLDRTVAIKAVCSDLRATEGAGQTSALRAAHLAAVIESTWIVLVFPSNVPVTVTLFPANSFGFS